MKMGNPFKIQSQAQQLMDFARQARALSQNPSGIGELLFNKGRINQEQFDAIKEMKSPSEIGNYLMNTGVLGQQQINNMAHAVPQIQNIMQNQ